MPKKHKVDGGGGRVTAKALSSTLVAATAAGTTVGTTAATKGKKSTRQKKKNAPPATVEGTGASTAAAVGGAAAGVGMVVAGEIGETTAVTAVMATTMATTTTMMATSAGAPPMASALTTTPGTAGDDVFQCAWSIYKPCSIFLTDLEAVQCEESGCTNLVHSVCQAIWEHKHDFVAPLGEDNSRRLCPEHHDYFIETRGGGKQGSGPPISDVAIAATNSALQQLSTAASPALLHGARVMSRMMSIPTQVNNSTLHSSPADSTLTAGTHNPPAPPALPIPNIPPISTTPILRLSDDVDYCSQKENLYITTSYRCG